MLSIDSWNVFHLSGNGVYDSLVFHAIAQVLYWSLVFNFCIFAVTMYYYELQCLPELKAANSEGVKILNSFGHSKLLTRIIVLLSSTYNCNKYM